MASDFLEQLPRSGTLKEKVGLSSRKFPSQHAGSGFPGPMVKNDESET
jgi:hypothetical protein